MDIVTALIPFIYYGLIICLIIYFVRLIKSFKRQIAILKDQIRELEKKGK